MSTSMRLPSLTALVARRPRRPLSRSTARRSPMAMSTESLDGFPRGDWRRAQGPSAQEITRVDSEIGRARSHQRAPDTLEPASGPTRRIGHQAELLDHTESVGDTPVRHDLAVLEAHDVDDVDPDVAAGGRPAHDGLVVAGRGVGAHPDIVAGCHDVVDGQLHVAE